MAAEYDPEETDSTIETMARKTRDRGYHQRLCGSRYSRRSVVEYIVLRELSRLADGEGYLPANLTVESILDDVLVGSPASQGIRAKALLALIADGILSITGPIRIYAVADAADRLKFTSRSQIGE